MSVGDIDLVKKMYGCEISVTGDNDLDNAMIYDQLSLNFTIQVLSYSL